MSVALLLSGGMDSTAIAFWRRPDLAVTVDYGQVPAEAEIRAAAAVCAELGIEQIVLRLPQLGILGSGDLAGTAAAPVAPRAEWWPFRNQLLATLAAAAVLPRGATRLMIGTLATDGHHADGTPGFVRRLDELLASQEGSLRLEAPALGLTAPELVRASGVPLELLAWAHSCHRANYACGECGGCRKHYRTLEALGERPY